MSTPSSPRARRARARLLDDLRANGASTRASLSARLDLAPSAIASTAAELIRDGYVREARTTAADGAGRGRRPGLLVAVPRAARVLGLDIGHRHVAVAVADENATVLAERRDHIDVDHRRRATLELAETMVRAVCADAGLAPADVDAFAACMPNTLASAGDGSGDLAELSARLGTPIAMINDADAGLLGELRFGAAVGVPDVIYVKVSHGVGAAFQLGGRPYRGHGGMSGEIGHIRLPATSADSLTAWCRCGNQGCLETVVSSPAVDARLDHTRAQSPPAQAGLDVVARRMLIESGRVLGHTLADLCTALNPAVLVIGGELATRVDEHGNSPLVTGVVEAVERFALPVIAAQLQVRPARLAQRAELVGVLTLAVDSLARA